MSQPCGYAVVRVHADSYRLDRIIPPYPGATAFVIRTRDRLGNPTGWKLKPLFVMQGARSRVWTDAAEVIASTRLLTLKQAHAVLAIADAAIQGATP